MRTQLLILSAVLASAPGISLYLTSSNGVIGEVGLVLVVVAFLILPVSFFSPWIGRLVWVVFGASLLVMLFAAGYLALVLPLTLGLSPGALVDLSISVLLAELGIVSSTLFATYKRYSLVMKNVGYEALEFEEALSAFTRTTFLIAAGIAGLSIPTFLVFEILPQLQLDSISALVIVGAVYFAITRYALHRRKSSTVSHPSTKI